MANARRWRRTSLSAEPCCSDDVVTTKILQNEPTLPWAEVLAHHYAGPSPPTPTPGQLGERGGGGLGWRGWHDKACCLA